MRFTNEKRERFLTLLECGRNVSEAAEAVGVTRQTVANWRNRGRLNEGPDYAEFAERMDAIGVQDDGLSQADLIRMLEKQARKNSIRAIQLLLERPWERKREAKVTPEIPPNPFAQVIDIETARQAKNN